MIAETLAAIAALITALGAVGFVRQGRHIKEINRAVNNKAPDEPYLRQAGMLPERERMIAFEAADITIAPAPDDLLAQSVLESMAVGTPVLASARNASAVAHCRRANAGLFYENREEFVEAMRLMTRSPELRERLGEAGRRYVDQHYRWDAVIGRFEHLIARVKPR